MADEPKQAPHFISGHVHTVQGTADFAGVEIKTTTGDFFFLMSPRSMLDLASKLTAKARFLEAPPPNGSGIQ